jgi:hypothetical protein
MVLRKKGDDITSFDGTNVLLHSTLRHLPPLRFHCVGLQESRTLATLALTVRHLARYHPQIVPVLVSFPMGRRMLAPLLMLSIWSHFFTLLLDWQLR